MKFQYKLIAILIVVLSAVGYVIYSQYKINKLSSDNKELTNSLESSLASNQELTNIISSYEIAMKEKEEVLKEAQMNLQQISEQLKGLQDEQSKAFLSTRTPSTIEQLLKSTDYYYKTDSNSSSK